MTPTADLWRQLCNGKASRRPCDFSVRDVKRGCYGGQPRPIGSWPSSHGSVLRRFAEQLRGGFDHPFAMPEQPIAVAADKVDLMPSAFLVHRLQVPERVRSGHFRDEFGQQVRFGPRPLEHFIASEHKLLEHDLLRAHQELQGVLVRLGQSRRGISYRLLNKRGTPFGKLCHDDLRFGVPQERYELLPGLTLSCIKPTDPAPLLT